MSGSAPLLFAAKGNGRASTQEQASDPAPAPRRQIVLDTETTGLEVGQGHRLIEIGCVELIQRRPTGRRFHRYVNPGRAIDARASEITGLTDQFLADKPPFVEVAEEFLAFIEGAELIIHNAEFDVGFLDNELALCGARITRLRDCAGIIDTLLMAREHFPGKRNALDALCSRFGIDNSHRTVHGALLDAELLAEVYLALTSGQVDLQLLPDTGTAASIPARFQAVDGAPLRRVVSNPAESELHDQALARIDQRSGGRCLWLQDGTRDSAQESA